MAKKNIFDLEKFDKYMQEQGMIDIEGKPVKLSRFEGDLNSITESVRDLSIMRGKKLNYAVIYFKRRKNKDNKGEYYARLYIPNKK